MIGALWILLATIAFGTILYIAHRYTAQPERDSSHPEASNVQDERPEGCCGQHSVCEKESLLAGISNQIEYYEDEELDSYRGLMPDEYTEAQIEQFRDVLYTLKPEEIGGWARSIQLREINLPSVVKDELIMLAAEARGSLHDTELKTPAK